MSDNVVSIGTKEPFVDAKAEQVAWLRTMADTLEQLDAPLSTAVAFLMHDHNTDGIVVKCEGFKDNQAAQRYLLTYMRNNGFKGQ
jgi:hypothetical protein